MAAAYWEHFEHSADMGVRGVGSTAAEAFGQAALAVTATVTDPADVEPRDKIEIDCAAPDLATLLVDWLNALVFEMATRRMLFSRFDVDIRDTRLHAEAYGEPVDRPRHRPATEVKGATFTELAVDRDANGRWRAQCIIDV